MKNLLFQKDIVSVDDLGKKEVDLIFKKTAEMEKLVLKKGGDQRLKGKIMAATFFEPSTRTFSSFITAMQRLGGGIIPLNGMQSTSVAKGESFEHSVRVFSQYVDCLVIRHSEVGKPKLAADIIDIPVINAGDGTGEHPTQALFDCYTILESFPHQTNLTVSLVGDLKNGRTVHSIAKLLPRLNKKIKFNFVSPKILSMPDDIKRNSGEYNETEKITDVVSVTDVFYITRVQKERFTDLSQYEKLKSYYMVDKNILKKAKPKYILMHPLPIAADEIKSELDNDKHSLYLNRELKNGLYLRMALLDLILLKNE